MNSIQVPIAPQARALSSIRDCPAGVIRHIFCAVAWIFFACALAEAGSYHLEYSTYLGGAKRWDQARDVCVDAAGNVYVTGGTTSVDFPTTPGAFDRTYNQGGKDIGSGGNCDAFVSKFDPDGKLVWSTFLGGPNYDRGYGIKVGAAGFVYVCGRAGPGFPVTAGAFQPAFHGINAGIYGLNNGFVAKLKPDGSGLVWASYVGGGSLCRDFDIDKSGNVFTHLAFENTADTDENALPATWFSQTFQPTRRGGTDNGVIKIAADGASVLWATWLGGSADEQKEACVRVDAEGQPCLLFWTKSADIATTPGAYDRKYHGGAGWLSRQSQRRRHRTPLGHLFRRAWRFRRLQHAQSCPRLRGQRRRLPDDERRRPARHRRCIPDEVWRRQNRRFGRPV